MKALVLSDSHGATRTLQALMERLEREGKPDALLYCGDGLSDIMHYRAWCPAFYAVRGNCDFTAPPDVAGELTARIGGVALNRVESWQFDDTDPMDDEVEQANTNPTSVYGFGHLPLYRHVADVLDGKDEPLLTGREGRKTVEIIEAAYESARTGKAVPIEGRVKW